jgi:hypothetical protein|tara:strand:+ start:601 stop:990 length:390 start_codon:yes stop_codon:yes gene_type:complete
MSETEKRYGLARAGNLKVIAEDRTTFLMGSRPHGDTLVYRGAYSFLMMCAGSDLSIGDWASQFYDKIKDRDIRPNGFVPSAPYFGEIDEGGKRITIKVPNDQPRDEGFLRLISGEVRKSSGYSLVVKRG